MNSKPVNESLTTMTEIVLPNDANIYGNVLGGKVMHMIDLCGAIAAFRHCRLPVVTVSVDSVVFLHPIKVGQLIIVQAILTRAFSTSMEVEVEVFSEDPLSGERKKTSTAFLTFVGLSEDGIPTRVPAAYPETAEQERNYKLALRRRQRRLEEVHVE